MSETTVGFCHLSAKFRVAAATMSVLRSLLFMLYAQLCNT